MGAVGFFCAYVHTGFLSYLKQTNNPYCVRVGDAGINLNFPNEPCANCSTSHS
ncbi:MAG: DUF6870 family protein [Dysosmobacter sp.]